MPFNYVFVYNTNMTILGLAQGQCHVLVGEFYITMTIQRRLCKVSLHTEKQNCLGVSWTDTVRDMSSVCTLLLFFFTQVALLSRPKKFKSTISWQTSYIHLSYMNVCVCVCVYHHHYISLYDYVSIFLYFNTLNIIWNYTYTVYLCFCFCFFYCDGQQN